MSIERGNQNRIINQWDDSDVPFFSFSIQVSTEPKMSLAYRLNVVGEDEASEFASDDKQ